MSTIKILIMNEYRRLQKNIQNTIHTCILPDLIESNIVDILLLFNYQFQSINDKNYKTLIDDVIEMQDNKVEQKERDLIYDIIYKFITWLKNIQSS